MNEQRGRKLGNAGAPSTLVRFPRAMKRGAKVRRGPCAEILLFPGQLSGEELESRFRWICSNDGEWANGETQGTEGVEHVSDERRQLMDFVRAAMGHSAPTDATKRQRIAEGCKRIEKRNRVKDWLASLGADLDEIATPEQALLFAFDRMQSGDRPTSA